MNDCGARSSVEGSHLTMMCPPSFSAVTFIGCVGGVWSLGSAGSVVTTTGSLTGEKFPSMSRARTVNVYVVSCSSGVQPVGTRTAEQVNEADFEFIVATGSPSMEMVYQMNEPSS